MAVPGLDPGIDPAIHALPMHPRRRGCPGMTEKESRLDWIPLQTGPQRIRPDRSKVKGPTLAAVGPHLILINSWYWLIVIYYFAQKAGPGSAKINTSLTMRTKAGHQGMGGVYPRFALIRT